MCDYCAALMSEEEHKKAVNRLAQNKLRQAKYHLVDWEGFPQWRPDSPTRAAATILDNAIKCLELNLEWDKF